MSASKKLHQTRPLGYLASENPAMTIEHCSAAIRAIGALVGDSPADLNDTEKYGLHLLLGEIADVLDWSNGIGGKA